MTCGIETLVIMSLIFLLAACSAGHDWDGDGSSFLDGDCRENDPEIHPGEGSALSCEWLVCESSVDREAPDANRHPCWPRGGFACANDVHRQFGWTGTCIIPDGFDEGYCQVTHYREECELGCDGDRCRQPDPVEREFELSWSDDVIYTLGNNDAVRHLHGDQRLPAWVDGIEISVTCYNQWLAMVHEEFYDFPEVVGDAGRVEARLVHSFDPEIVEVCIARLTLNGEGDPVPRVIYGEMRYELLDTAAQFDAVHGLPVPGTRSYFIDLTPDHRHAPPELPPIVE